MKIITHTHKFLYVSNKFVIFVLGHTHHYSQQHGSQATSNLANVVPELWRDSGLLVGKSK